VELDGKLAAIQEGKEKAASDGERLALAQLCLLPSRMRYASASRFYAEAFAHDAKLADDMQAQHRYNAACSAALAGCGQGRDASELDDKERARLRRKAVLWLRADLAHWTKQVQSAKPSDRTVVRQTLQHWQDDSDLAGLREMAALQKLPADERELCQKLWADVADLLKKVQGKAP
jgi:hypothetical protein